MQHLSQTPAPEETWLDLEKLAARIYAELEPGSTVSHNASVPGVLTGIDRQIDVLIENEALATRVVVDCKDWKKRVSVPDAHAFAGLIEDVEATSWILICNRGFSKATATLAKAKGFQLAKLHDVESHRWRLDVRIPIVWTRLWLEDVHIGVLARLKAGDVIETDRKMQLWKGDKRVDLGSFFEEAWNRGDLHTGEAGEGQLRAKLDWERAAGEVVRDVDVVLDYRVGASSKLGYVTPQEARGIFDEETRAFTTVHFNVGETLKREPEGGWIDIFNPKELAIELRGTAITMDDTAGIEAVTLGRVQTVRGAEPRTSGLSWTRAET